MEKGTQFGRLSAFLKGFSPEFVWPTYKLFQDDIESLVELIELLEGEAKPILEERERRKLG